MGESGDDRGTGTASTRRREEATVDLVMLGGRVLTISRAATSGGDSR